MEWNRNLLLVGIAVILILAIVVYFVFMRQTKKQGKTDEPIPVLVKSEAQPVLTAPANVRIKKHEMYTDVLWDAVDEALHYELRYMQLDDTTAKDVYLTYGPIQETVLTLSNVKPGKYKIAVAAFTDQEKYKEAYSVSEWHETVVEQAEVDLEISHEVVSDKSMRVSWIPKEGANRYKMYINYDLPAAGDVSDFMIIEIDDPSTTSHVLYDMSPKYTWYVKVTQT